MSSIAAGIGPPRSRASSVVPALRPPPALWPPDQEPSRVEPERLSAAGEPLKLGVAVLNGRRVGELGCETEVHPGRDGAGPIGTSFVSQRSPCERVSLTRWAYGSAPRSVALVPMILRPSPGLQTECRTRARCLPNLVGDSRAFRYAFSTRARSPCGTRILDFGGVGAVVHAADSTTQPGWLGCPVITLVAETLSGLLCGVS